MVVVVKTPVTFSAGSPLVNGAFDRVNKPTSVEAVEATKIRSCRFGGKSFSRCMK